MNVKPYYSVFEIRWQESFYSTFVLKVVENYQI